MRLTLSRGDMFSVGTLSLTWAGIWGAWIPHKTASLTQNALNLAEWSTFLMDVRVGDMAHVPEILRLAASLASVALAVGVGSAEKHWQRWIVRIIAVLAGLFILPPYPEILKLWWSESYGLRFIMAAVAWFGIAGSALTDTLPDQMRRGTVVVISILAAASGVWAFRALRPPFEAHYTVSITPGWGMLAFLGGLLATVTLQAITIGRHMRREAVSKSMMS